MKFLEKKIVAQVSKHPPMQKNNLITDDYIVTCFGNGTYRVDIKSDKIYHVNGDFDSEKDATEFALSIAKNDPYVLMHMGTVTCL